MSGKQNLHLHRSVVAWPEQDQERNAFAIKIPALLGIPRHSLIR
ncbi:hypothetical protein ACNKHM_01440 [Shigella sonnei]